jgi:membrane protein implicated in regulation of membrane protease activity
MQLLENPALFWFLIGLALLLAELAFPGLIVIFFGAGAWITGLVFILFDFSFNGQLIVFILSSILSLVFFRKSLQQRWWQKRYSGNELADEFLGRTCSVTVPILPGPGGGKVYFKGTTWKAVANVEIPAGNTVRIIGKDSIVLLVEPIV